MNLQPVWEYFGNFNDAEAVRIVVLLIFVVGTPLVVGVTAKLWIWAIRQVRSASQFLHDDAEIAVTERIG